MSTMEIKAENRMEPCVLNPNFGLIETVEYDPEMVEDFDTRSGCDMMSSAIWGKSVELDDGRTLVLVSHGYTADGYTSTERNYIAGEFEQ